MFKNIQKNPKNLLIGLSLVMVMALLPSSVYAASQSGTLSSFMATIGETLSNGKALVAQFFYFMGVVLWGVGILLFRKESKEEGRGHMKNGFISIGVGTALLIFPTLISWSAAETGATQTGSAVTKDADW